MRDQIIGYYIEHKDSLLKEFDQIISLMEGSLVKRWGLVRTQTLADGCRHCDFRFKKGAATQVFSKTPEVQETIERIRKKEG
jgi:hypothetical protein